MRRRHSAVIRQFIVKEAPHSCARRAPPATRSERAFPVCSLSAVCYGMCTGPRDPRSDSWPEASTTVSGRVAIDKLESLAGLKSVRLISPHLSDSTRIRGVTPDPVRFLPQDFLRAHRRHL